MGTVRTDYEWDGSALLAEQTGSDKILYLYDGSGLIGFKRNGTTYTYVYNGLGDVMEILDSSGNAVVSYLYDAWGAPISITGPMASTLGIQNPIRYRGYYYDTETGLYYLQSRYYDPVVGRFINADELLGANGDLMSYNLYAYCSNNPVNMSDPTGESAALVALFAATVGLLIAEGFSPANKERADNFMNDPNLYNTANWLTLGAVDTVKGAIRPEDPLSLQHWSDSAQTALMILPAVSKGASLLDSWRYSSGSLFKFPRRNPLALETPQLTYPGNNPAVGPKGFEWRGSGDPLSGKGSWYNPKLDISLHADLNHGPPIGPHWDMVSPDGKYRIFPDGTIRSK